MTSFIFIRLLDDVFVVYSTPLSGSFVTWMVIWRDEVEEEENDEEEEEEDGDEEEEDEEDEEDEEESRRSPAESTMLDSVCSLITGTQPCTSAFILAITEGTIAIW